jgi:hypothetical protein
LPPGYYKIIVPAASNTVKIVWPIIWKRNQFKICLGEFSLFLEIEWEIIYFSCLFILLSEIKVRKVHSMPNMGMCQPKVGVDFPHNSSVHPMVHGTPSDGMDIDASNNHWPLEPFEL